MIELADNFLETYAELKTLSKDCAFSDIKNPIDDVIYPFICKDIPKHIKNEVFNKLSLFKGSEILNPVLFLRMSPKGVNPPHFAHTDKVMGDFSFMLYLNDGSGTQFLRHIMTGISYHPLLETFQKIIEKDQNNRSAWTIYQRVPAKENRAIVFDAGNIHAAGDPFGETQDDARIVLTCFFS